MLDMAMRVETQSGNRTNAASENSSIFDTRITVGVASEGGDVVEAGVEDGRPVLACPRGSFLWLPEYTYNLHTSPDVYHVSSLTKGMYADNPTLPDDIPMAAERLLQGGQTTPEIATFLGSGSVRMLLEELDLSDDRLTASYLSRAVLIAVNYAQRSSFQPTTIVDGNPYAEPSQLAKD